MTTNTPAGRIARYILIATALLLPTLSLIPMGGLYLYEHGLLLWWAGASLVAVLVAFMLQRSLLRRTDRVITNLEQDAVSATMAPQSAEDHALADVRKIAQRVDIDTLTSTHAFLALGQQTIDAVARRMHPEKTDAIWQFTLPEALLITERVSSRLGDFVETRIPFGDQLTVAQLLAVYRWRGVVGVAERAYDVWRIVRLANPATAITNEAREQLSRAVLNWSKERVSRRLVEAYVEEVGRAAIDLYGGRLHHSLADSVLDAATVTPPLGDPPANSSSASSTRGSKEKRRGFWGSARQAASASATLTRDIIRPKPRDRQH